MVTTTKMDSGDYNKTGLLKMDKSELKEIAEEMGIDTKRLDKATLIAIILIAWSTEGQ